MWSFTPKTPSREPKLLLSTVYAERRAKQVIQSPMKAMSSSKTNLTLEIKKSI
jgi:hypothetical protein